MIRLRLMIPKEMHRRPQDTRLCMLLYSSPYSLPLRRLCGEVGIRTLGGGFPPQLLSRQLPSTARPPLRRISRSKFDRMS